MKELNEWFLANQRDFPWRQDRTPYKVWISEVMLQQTRASVVVPYFERWLKLFPDVSTLAKAAEETVIKAWEGLGYYSRARNLHEGAKQMVARFRGEVPGTAEELASIRGLGPYTIGAILSFGFSQRAAAVDGNVTRVLSRYFLIEENVCKQSTKRLIGQKAEEVLDGKEPWVTSEALIELGASLCAPKPRCDECPLRRGCLAFQTGKTEHLPIKNEPEKTISLWRAVCLVESQGKFLVKKGGKGKVMADLYEFPYREMEGPSNGRQEVKKFCEQLGIRGEVLQPLTAVKHTFTKYKAHLYPFLVKTENRAVVPGYEWLDRDELTGLPFSSGHRKILGEIG